MGQNLISRLVHSIFKKVRSAMNTLKPQGMPKYQNLYLGQGGGKVRVTQGGEAIVTGCFYDPDLASYMYWLDANGESVLVPEKYIKPID
jgi:hypothetical protein